MDNSVQMTYLLTMFTSLINSLDLEKEEKKELIKSAEQGLPNKLGEVCLNIIDVAKPDNLIDCLKELGDHLTSAGFLMNIAGEEAGGNTRLAEQFNQEQRGTLIDIVLLKGGKGTISMMTTSLFSVAGAFNFENQSKLVSAFLETLPPALQAGIASPQRINLFNQRIWKNLDPSLRRMIHQRLNELCPEDGHDNPSKPN